MVEGSSPGLERKVLESIRGFLNYDCLMYEVLTPYLKGLHLTIDSWRPDRDSEGWKIRTKEGRDKVCQDPVENPEAPKFVSPVNRLRDDVNALKILTSGESPTPEG